MRNLMLLLVLTGLLLAAFAVGRFTAGPPTFEPGAVLADDPLEQAWQEFSRSLQETHSLFRDSEFFADDQERAEAYRTLLYALINGIKTAALMNPDQPRFMRTVDWTSKRGLENPDNNYYLATIRDDADYRIIGQRGSSRNLIFQLVVGVPGVRGAGTSTNVSVLNGSDLAIEADGSFEVIVSRVDPGDGSNWLPNGEGARTLLARFSHVDWDTERPGRLRIEKIGAEGDSSMPLTPARMAQGFSEIAVNLYDASATWIGYGNKMWTLASRNDISAARGTQGGLVGQYSAFGSWELNNDQAIILSTTPSDASYQGIELGNLWFTSLDYESHTSSLTLDQMQCSGDGRCYAVISHRDPGIQNWLDTEGHRRGLIFMRWQGLEQALPEQQHPQARLVSFADLASELPADIPAFDEAQRRQQIQQRRANVHERFDG
jgi:hypothetical protein